MVPIETRPRIVGAMMGDLTQDPTLYAKYGFLFDAVARRFPLVDVCDASLTGLGRYLLAARVVHPDRRQWRQRYYKYPRAFVARSRQAARAINAIGSRADVVLQVNTMFDATWPDIVLPNVIFTDYTGRLSAQRPGGGRSPFRATTREEWIDLERRTYERAAHIGTRSHLVRDSIINDYSIAGEKVSVVGGGLNFPSIPEPVGRGATESPTVLFIGKDLYRKGGDLLLRAFAQARERHPNARMVFITGERPPKDLPLQNVDVILNPVLGRDQFPAIYQQADIFALPSRLETWGDVVLEAMSFELPCIGVRGHAMQEIIQHERTGLLVPEGDVNALAAALERMLENVEERLAWGLAGRQRAIDHFTWDKVVDRLAPAIEAAAASASRRDAGTLVHL